MWNRQGVLIGTLLLFVMSTEITYDNIDRPYDSQLSRIGASSIKRGSLLLAMNKLINIATYLLVLAEPLSRPGTC